MSSFSESQQPAVDLSRIAEIAGDDTEFMREVFAEFVKEVAMRVARCQEALDGADAPLGRQHSHSIKGAALNAGANDLARAASEIERACRDEDLALARVGMPRLRTEFARVEEFLRAQFSA